MQDKTKVPMCILANTNGTIYPARHMSVSNLISTDLIVVERFFVERVKVMDERSTTKKYTSNLWCDLRSCILQLDESRTKPKKHHNIFHLLKTRNIRNVTFIVCLVW